MSECAFGTCKEDSKLFVCSRCKSVFYCSRGHQKQDWNNHKALCIRVSSSFHFLSELRDKGRPISLEHFSRDWLLSSGSSNNNNSVVIELSLFVYILGVSPECMCLTKPYIVRDVKAGKRGETVWVCGDTDKTWSTLSSEQFWPLEDGQADAMLWRARRLAMNDSLNNVLFGMMQDWRKARVNLTWEGRPIVNFAILEFPLELAPKWQLLVEGVKIPQFTRYSVLELTFACTDSSSSLPVSEYSSLSSFLSAPSTASSTAALSSTALSTTETKWLALAACEFGPPYCYSVDFTSDIPSEIISVVVNRVSKDLLSDMQHNSSKETQGNLPGLKTIQRDLWQSVPQWKTPICVVDKPNTLVLSPSVKRIETDQQFQLHAFSVDAIISEWLMNNPAVPFTGARAKEMAYHIVMETKENMRGAAMRRTAVLSQLLLTYYFSFSSSSKTAAKVDNGADKELENKQTLPNNPITVHIQSAEGSQSKGDHADQIALRHDNSSVVAFSTNTSQALVPAFASSVESVREVRELLESIALTSFVDLLVNEGFDSLRCLESLQLDDLLALGMKRGHARTLLTEIQKKMEEKRQK